MRFSPSGWLSPNESVSLLLHYHISRLRMVLLLVISAVCTTCQHLYPCSMPIHLVTSLLLWLRWCRQMFRPSGEGTDGAC